MKNLKVEELSSQEMKNVEGGFAFIPFLVWGAGAVFSTLVGAGVGYALNAIYPSQQSYYYY
ncbi:class IIb bacteriocin, lactobin A/cerein 7B family [Chryseobacterium nematophagum]|nr:class IIb bacteriocin, lactobin A/cerein 7B family [Chryseobacterium nematophagum]